MQGFVSRFNYADILVGELQSVDGYMNIALEKTEEYVGGVKKRSYGDAFVRGNNGEIKIILVPICSFPNCVVASVMYISADA